MHPRKLEEESILGVGKKRWKAFLKCLDYNLLLKMIILLIIYTNMQNLLNCKRTWKRTVAQNEEISGQLLLGLFLYVKMFIDIFCTIRHDRKIMKDYRFIPLTTYGLRHHAKPCNVCFSFCLHFLHLFFTRPWMYAWTLYLR